MLSRPGMWLRYYICLPMMPCGGYQQGLCYVTGSELFQFLLYLLSVYGLGQIRYEGSKKRQHNGWILLLPYVKVRVRAFAFTK